MKKATYFLIYSDSEFYVIQLSDQDHRMVLHAMKNALDYITARTDASNGNTRRVDDLVLVVVKGMVCVPGFQVYVRTYLESGPVDNKGDIKRVDSLKLHEVVWDNFKPYGQTSGTMWSCESGLSKLYDPEDFWPHAHLDQYTAEAPDPSWK